MSDTGHEVGVPRWRHHKNNISSPCQHLGNISNLQQICSQGFQDNMVDCSLPRQSRTNCTQPMSGLCQESCHDCPSSSGPYFSDAYGRWTWVGRSVEKTCWMQYWGQHVLVEKVWWCGVLSPIKRQGLSSSEVLESTPFTCWLFLYSIMFHPLIVCESHLYTGAPSMHDLCLMPCGECL